MDLKRFGLNDIESTAAVTEDDNTSIQELTPPLNEGFLNQDQTASTSDSNSGAVASRR